MAKSILIRILGEPGPAIDALREVGVRAQETAAETDTIGKSGEQSGSKLASFGKAAAASIVGVGAVAVELGNKLEDAHAALAVAVQDAGGSMTELAPKIAATDKAMESFGYTNAQTEAALATMTIGLHNPAEAMRLMGLAANIATARHIDLAAAATLVVKASEGQTMALRRAGIDLPVVASSALKVKVAQEALAKAQDAVNAILLKTPDAVDANSKAHAKYEAALQKVQAAQQKLSDLQSSGGQIIDALSQRYGGQAAAAADTFSGRMEVMKARVEDLGARLGVALIPILEKLMSVVAGVVGWLEKHRAVAELLAVVVGTIVVAALVAYTVNMIAAAAATLVAAAPILAIIAVIALVGVGIFELVKHWKQVWGDIKHWADEAWQFIKRIFNDGVEFVKKHWKDMVEALLVLVTGGIALIPVLIFRYWGQITQFTAQLWNDITGFFTSIWHDVTSWVSRTVGDVVNFFTGLPGRVFSGLANIGQGIVNFFTGIPDDIYNNVIQPIITFFEDLPGKILDVIGSLGSDIIHAITHDIPGSGVIGGAISAIGGLFEEGGFVPGEGPQLAIVHGGEYVLSQADVAGLTQPGGSGRFTAPSANASASGPSGDLVLQLGNQEFARVAGPVLRTWLLQNTKRDAVRVGLT